MKTKDLRVMSREDINAKLIELKKEMIKHNAQIATGTTPKSPGQVKPIKKTIAKIMTLLGTKKLGDQKSPNVSTLKKSVEKEPKIAEEAETKNKSDSSSKKVQKEEAKASEKTKTEEKING